ncbi:MAG: hypothetical protein AAFW73_26355 [Bacteroidota bacterium]
MSTIKRVPERLQMFNADHVVVSNDPQYIDACSTIFFQNQGTTRVVLNDHIVLDPLEFYRERADDGCALVDAYSIKFIPLADPPTADPPRIWSGNRLYVRTQKRKSYG